MKCKKKICFIAQFPPPIHGLSKAVETLYGSSIKDNYSLEKIDITNNYMFLINIVLLLKSKADLFYFTISQSIGGNIRDLILLKLMQMKKKRIIVHLHGGYYRYLLDNDMCWLQKKVNYSILSKVDGAIVLGESLKWIFKDIIDEKKIYIVPNCVDDQYLISDGIFSKKINSVDNNGIFHVLWLSNFIRSKGYDKVLELALMEQKNFYEGKGIRFHFDFAGRFYDEIEEKYFFNYIKENKLEEFVTYHGIVEGVEKKDLLIKCMFFILPTRYKKEGQPISILEAMGNGMVILTTNYAGIPDIVDENINGYFLDVDNLEILYKKIYNLNNDTIKDILINNRKSVYDLYRQINYVGNMKNIFDLVMKGEQ